MATNGYTTIDAAPHPSTETGAPWRPGMTEGSRVPTATSPDVYTAPAAQAVPVGYAQPAPAAASPGVYPASAAQPVDNRSSVAYAQPAPAAASPNVYPAQHVRVQAPVSYTQPAPAGSPNVYPPPAGQLYYVQSPVANAQSEAIPFATAVAVPVMLRGPTEQAQGPGLPGGQQVVSVQGGLHQFSTGICDCCGDCNSMFLAWCCSWKPWGDTAVALGRLTSQQVLFCYTLPWVLYMICSGIMNSNNAGIVVTHYGYRSAEHTGISLYRGEYETVSLLWGYLILRVISTIAFVWMACQLYQQRKFIKQKYDIPHDPCTDGCLVCCCSCCTVAQEFKHVRHYPLVTALPEAYHRTPL